MPLLFLTSVLSIVIRPSFSFVTPPRRPFHSARFAMNTEEREDSTTTPTWCPEQQIYIGGIVPDSGEVQKLLDGNEGNLCLFGYGSLCWGPGTGVLSKSGVTTTPGRARGYKRCWAQKSADHRGTTNFPGIVCTLLRDDEVEQIVKEHRDAPTMTEGLLYTVPAELVEECLAELDFREKGGYARDVIDVVEDESGDTVKALLYRGTPDNPAFWSRALLNLPFAAATMAVSIGPSGRNDVYLHNLDGFMQKAAASCTAAAEALHDHTGDTDTGDLSTMVVTFQKSYNLFFLFGSGSNQHNQLLLRSKNGNLLLKNGEDAWEMNEIVLCTKKEDGKQIPRQLYAGGGHSGLLTEGGLLYLWGWNQHGQLGTSEVMDDKTAPLPCIRPLQDIQVEQAALGFSHTLVIETETGRLYAFGDNSRGQVDGTLASPSIQSPVIPSSVEGDSFVHVAAGLFHSAAISAEGELLTFGCGRFGQCLSRDNNNTEAWTVRWRPNDGSRLVRVACGRRHTAVLDEHGRVWTFGENKYGQLGRDIEDRKFDEVPGLVEGALGEKGSGCFAIDCGWSHLVASTPDALFGWGRNDKGQLGTGSKENISAPAPIFQNFKTIRSIACGSESTMVLDESGIISGCGWNEHGNLAVGDDSDRLELKATVGARIVAPPPSEDDGRILMAKGGAHLLAMKV